MDTENKHKGMKVAIIGCAEAGKSVLAQALIERLGSELVMVNIDEIDIEKLEPRKIKPELLKLTMREDFEMPFIEPTKKPYHDKNVRRHSRKSKW